MTAIGGAIECEHEQFQKRNQEKFFSKKLQLLRRDFKEGSGYEEVLGRHPFFCKSIREVLPALWGLEPAKHKDAGGNSGILRGGKMGRN